MVDRIEIEPRQAELPYESDDCPFAPQKLMGVALLGALSSVVLYYLYANLAPETRQSIKDNVTTKVKAGLQNLTQT